MFGFLKKKVGEFASKMAQKTEEKLEEKPANKSLPAKPPAPSKKSVAKRPAAKKAEKPEAEKPENPALNKPADKREIPEAKKAENPALNKPFPSKGDRPPEKISVFSKIKKSVVGETGLSESELEGLLWEFELALLEADVAQPVVEEIISGLKKTLATARFSRSENIALKIEGAVRDSIKSIISLEGFSIPELARSGKKPFVIMFLGPNGAGKTTTLAKVAHLLKNNGISCLFAASDTFRAASMEQLQHHADALGIRVVKHGYGADPAAVAFDAIKSAEAKGIDCVLIDTAGRQETNKNLMEELKKIQRVSNPDLLIYLDEALAGNALVERISEFKEAVGVHGVILSKMDMDVKGGGTISIARVTGVPIVYYGVGQSYGDLKPFDADELLKRIFD